jgi:hypothetical protein
LALLTAVDLLVLDEVGGAIGNAATRRAMLFDRGWFWYEREPEPVEDLEPAPAPQPQLPEQPAVSAEPQVSETSPQGPNPLSAQWLREHMGKYRDAAIARSSTSACRGQLSVSPMRMPSPLSRASSRCTSRFSSTPLSKVAEWIW